MQKINWENELGLTEGKEFELQDAGDGVFLCLFYEPDESAEEYLFNFCSEHFEEVSWCPDPESHGDKVIAVLNCFYGVD